MNLSDFSRYRVYLGDLHLEWVVIEAIRGVSYKNGEKVVSSM